MVLECSDVTGSHHTFNRVSSARVEKNYFFGEGRIDVFSSGRCEVARAARELPRTPGFPTRADPSDHDHGGWVLPRLVIGANLSEQWRPNDGPALRGKNKPLWKEDLISRLAISGG
jgi:hypothetical protein